jgi:hypothetical protein
MDSQQQQLQVSVLLHRDGETWVAQCLEYDVAVQGRNKDEAQQRFLRALTSQIGLDLAEDRAPLSNLSPAPKRYFDDAVRTTQGPTLPVWVPVQPKKPRVQATARFLAAFDQ